MPIDSSFEERLPDYQARPLYSVILPAYNEASSLIKTLTCLRHAMASWPWPGEIIVTDNASTDDTAEIARNYGAIVVFESLRQIARARNTGARVAQGTLLIFLDADTLLPASLLAKAIQGMLQDSLAGGGGCLTFGRACSEDAQGSARIWNRFSRTVNVACGCFIFCRKEAFMAVGGFSEEIYAGEEIFLSRRLKIWARSNGKAFRIIPFPLLLTSDRKFHWYSKWSLFWQFIPLILFPFALRYRGLCKLWYHRPKEH